MGQTKTFFVLLCAVAIWTVELFVVAPPLLAEDDAVSVSIIADSLPGPGIRHGLRKVRAALREKGVRFEQVSSLRKAKGRIEIVAGIAYIKDKVRGYCLPGNLWKNAIFMFRRIKPG